VVTKNIAIILARGGSKRLPRKNLMKFHGKPMLAWTVEAAVQSKLFSRVLVSTDDAEIAEVGRAFGADVPFLRNTAADDMASSSLASLAALSQAEQHWGEQYEVATQLMANCPLRDANDITNAVKNFIDLNAVAQISCFRFGWMNPWWAAKLNQENKPEYVFPEARTARSQDLPQLYCPTGAIWISQVAALKEQGSFYIPGHVFHPLHWISAMDIDDMEDLEMAKACYLVKQQGKINC